MFSLLAAKRQQATDEGTVESERERESKEEIKSGRKTCDTRAHIKPFLSHSFLHCFVSFRLFLDRHIFFVVLEIWICFVAWSHIFAFQVAVDYRYFSAAATAILSLLSFWWLTVHRSLSHHYDCCIHFIRWKKRKHEISSLQVDVREFTFCQHYFGDCFRDFISLCFQKKKKCVNASE